MTGQLKLLYFRRDGDQQISQGNEYIVLLEQGDDTEPSEHARPGFSLTATWIMSLTGRQNPTMLPTASVLMNEG